MWQMVESLELFDLWLASVWNEVLGKDFGVHSFPITCQPCADLSVRIPPLLYVSWWAFVPSVYFTTSIIQLDLVLYLGSSLIRMKTAHLNSSCNFKTIKRRKRKYLCISKERILDEKYQSLQNNLRRPREENNWNPFFRKKTVGANKLHWSRKRPDLYLTLPVYFWALYHGSCYYKYFFKSQSMKLGRSFWFVFCVCIVWIPGRKRMKDFC